MEVIPSMRFVIHTFGGCKPALDWAADMDVQKGWEVCVEPGWLMLLAFNTQNHIHAVGLTKSVECEAELIASCLHHIKDSFILEMFDKAVAFGLDPKNPDFDDDVIYIQAITKLTYDKIRSEASNQSFKNANMPEYFAMQAVMYFLKAMQDHKNTKISAKWANSAIDATVNSLLAEKHPDFIGPSFGIGPLATKDEIDNCKLMIKIDLCNKLRTIIPKPYTTYDE